METLKNTTSQLPEEILMYKELMGKLHTIVGLEVWSSTVNWGLGRYIQNLKDTDPKWEEKINDLIKYIDTIPEYDRAYIISHLLYELIKTAYIPFLEQKITEEKDQNKARRLRIHKTAIIEGIWIQKQVKSAWRPIIYGGVATEYVPAWVENYQADILSLDDYMINKNSIYGRFFSWKRVETWFTIISPNADHGPEIRKVIADFLTPFLEGKYTLVEKKNQYGELKQYIMNLDGSDIRPDDEEFKKILDKAFENKDILDTNLLKLNKEVQKKRDKQKNLDLAIRYQQNAKLEELKKKLLE